MMPRANKSINFEPENHAVIDAVRRKLITKKDKMVTLEDTVMEGVKLLEDKMEKKK
jgi:hypothetical protein